MAEESALQMFSEMLRGRRVKYARAPSLNDSDQWASLIPVLLKSEQEMHILPSPVTTVPKSDRRTLTVNKRHRRRVSPL